ncbi:uncharacterized protein LOC136082308 isoform X1 [Hydra vulgaris]|uniref:uncharacterized protein LOC136082308 isoform X1 n=1 Tax=Hydra vulgaris TaxID=6087 RepID=UPI0032EA8A13
MSSQDTEGDEEVSAFFRNVQEIRAEEVLPTEIMDKLKKLEDSVENLKKLEHSMGKQNLIILHLCIIDKDIAFYFQKKIVFYGLLAFLIQILAFFFIGLIFEQLKSLENSIASSAVPSGNVFCILMQF